MGDYGWLKNILEQETEPITDKQKAVIKAAVELFSEKGYAATSTKEIAQRAGVAEGTIFKQYPTKKDLMLWITKRVIDAALLPLISSGLSELLEKNYTSREELLIAFFQNRMDLMQEGAPLFKILFQEMPFQPEIRAMLIAQIQKMPLDRIVDKIMVSGISDFSQTDIMQILLTCIAGFFFLHNIMMPELFQEGKQQDDIATMVRFINRGISC
jgi:AcrR family transcriptional regulator